MKLFEKTNLNKNPSTERPIQQQAINDTMRHLINCAVITSIDTLSLEDETQLAYIGLFANFSDAPWIGSTHRSARVNIFRYVELNYVGK